MDNCTGFKFSIGVVVANGELNCSNCKNYLSVGPVLYNSKFGNICGRKACALLASLDGDNSVQVLYGKFFRFSQFPCRYRSAGCLSSIKWDRVKEHEEACEYKNFACPFLDFETKCYWNGDDSEFLSHAQILHPEREFKNFRKIAEIPKLNQEYFFLNIVENIVLIMLYLDDTRNSLLCKLWGGDFTRKRLTYQLKFIDGTTREFISTRAKEVEVLHPRASEDIKQNYYEMGSNTMRDLLTDISFFGINFRFDNAEVEIKKLDVLPSKRTRIANFIPNRFILAMCAFCESQSETKCISYFFSDCGAICDDCFSSKRFKPTDTLAVTTYNNISLLSDRPCKNSSRGCDYIGSFFSIQAHHNNCEYTEKKCIFCDVLVENLMTHAKEHHEVINNGDSCNLELKRSTKSQYIILFDGHLFFLNFQINENRELIYEIDCADTKEVRYTYVLEFDSLNFPFSAITMKNICYPGEVSFEEFKISDKLSKKTKIPHVVLEKFFPRHRKLRFRMEILK